MPQHSCPTSCACESSSKKNISWIILSLNPDRPLVSLHGPRCRPVNRTVPRCWSSSNPVLPRVMRGKQAALEAGGGPHWLLQSSTLALSQRHCDIIFTYMHAFIYVVFECCIYVYIYIQFVYSSVYN